MASSGTFIAASGDTAAGLLNDFEASTAGRLTYIGPRPKIFRASSTVSLSTTSNNVVFVVGIAKNGTVIEASKTKFTDEASTDVGAAACQNIMSLESGDYVEGFIGSDNAGVDVTSENFDLIITEV